MVLLAIGGVVVYTLGGAGDFIRVQIEKYGSEYLDTEVNVANVELAYGEGRLTIAGTTIKNPTGFSNDNAFSLNDITLDLGDITGEPYTVQKVLIDAPEVLYEVDTSGKGNLLVLKDNLSAKLPEPGEPAPTTEDSAAPGPKVVVENVTVSNVKLRLNFEALDTSQIKLDKKAYEVTLPTFSAGSIGKPNGLPAEQVGGAIAQAMLDNILVQAKKEAKDLIKDAAKEKAKEKLAEETDKLKDKAKDKLKKLFN